MTAQLQLLDAFEARLHLLTVANGYHRTVEKITRATLTPFAGDDLPALNYWPTLDKPVARGPGWVERELTVLLEYYDRTRERPFTDVALELAEDVTVVTLRSPTAPLVSDAPDATLGGLAKGVFLTTITPQIGQGQTPWCGAILAYNIPYRVSSGNPFILLPGA